MIASLHRSRPISRSVRAASIRSKAGNAPSALSAAFLGALCGSSSALRSFALRTAGRKVDGAAKKAFRDDRGAQLVEFAVALPLLVLFVVGIFDFSNAFTFKQKLTNIARDAARVAAADPAGDLRAPSTTAPASVIDAFQIIDGYLIANNINDCGITLNGAPTNLTWTSTANGNGCTAGGLTIVINRGYYFSPGSAAQIANVNCATQPLTGGSSQTAIIGTCVSISYAYQWRFGKIASVLGSTMSLPMAITVASVAMNEN